MKRNIYVKWIKKNRQEMIYSIVLMLITTVLVFWFYNLWHYDFNVPLLYTGGDGMFLQRVLKGIQDNNTIFTNQFLGAPFVAEFYDFPMYADSLHIFIIIVIARIFDNLALALNIYYILMFPLTALISYFVMRNLNIKHFICVMASMVFTFLPYRFYRSVGHYFLSAYTLIPLGILILIWIITDERFFKFEKDFWKYKRNYIAIITLILSAISGIYYIFFLCFFIVITILIKFLYPKLNKKQTIIQGVFLMVIPCITVILVAIPSFYNIFMHGKSIEAPVRQFQESEMYGLKINEFFIPLQSHGISIVEKVINKYNNGALLITENRGAYLGIVGIIGFIILLFYLLITFKKEDLDNERMVLLSRLNLMGVLLATVGGFGSLFAFFISAQIRAYNRISVYIAYFCILAVAISVNSLYKYMTKLSHKRIILSSFILLCTISILEQASFVSNHDSYIKNYYSDKEFVGRIEKIAGGDGMIFQLPYQAFPEVPPINNMSDYKQSIGYLHSNTLRWSYGNYKGRIGDLWVRETSNLPIKQMIEKISLAGFDGIYINSLGYKEEELNNLMNNIEQVLDVKPILSQNGELIYYDMNRYNNYYKSKYTQEEWKKREIDVLIQIFWAEGFYELERNGVNEWRWSDQESELIIYNSYDKEIDYSISFKVLAEHSPNKNIYMNYNNNEYVYKAGEKIDFDISLNPGRNIIKLTTNVERIEAPLDPRSMYFKIVDFECGVK